jgi:hypothetical protein
MRWTLAGSLLVLAAACRSDQGFTPFAGYPELEAEHGQWLSMARAPDGSPTMAFYDKSAGALGFAIGDVRSDGVLWRYERADGYPSDGGLDGGDVGTHTDHTFAPDGSAWVSYHGPGQGNLKVARRVGKTWTSESVDAGSGLRPSTGLWTSIAIDAAGEPVVVYHDENGGTLRMATRAAGVWKTETIWTGQPFSGTDEAGNPVERPADVGEYAQIHIDGNTHYIAFYDRAQGDLVLLEGFAGAYVSTVVASEGDVGAWPSLVVEGGNVALTYHDITNQDLKLAIREGGGRFTVTTLDDGPYRGADSALYKRDGRWGVVYFDGRNNDLVAAAQGADASWTRRTVSGNDGAHGFHNEVVQDGAGRWWVGTYDYTSRKLKVRRLE